VVLTSESDGGKTEISKRPGLLWHDAGWMQLNTGNGFELQPSAARKSGNKIWLDSTA
jgi:hypothetical protein